MHDLTIAIPSSSRAGSVATLKWIPASLRDQVVLTVPEAQERTYRLNNPGWRILPVPLHGIAPTRQWLTDWCPTRYLLQISDDMKFAVRTDEETASGAAKLAPCTLRDMEQMFAWLYGQLQCGIAHVSISQRAGNNREPGLVRDCGRMCDIYAHDLSVLRAEGVRWDHLPVMEDFDATLQLLRLGYRAAISYQWCWDQTASNAPGGCSEYRTLAIQEAGARGLLALHGPYVRLTEKKSTNWQQGMAVRMDVVVQWAKALAYGENAARLKRSVAKQVQAAL